MVDSRHFLFSFLDIAAHYVAFFLGLLLVLYLSLNAGWPEQLQLWTLPEDRRDEFMDAWKNEPERLFPAALNATVVAGGLVLAGCLGFSVARFAPFSPAGHGTFLAVLCVLTFLQIAFSQPQLPKLLVIPLTIASAAGIVSGSRLADRRMVRASEDSTDSGH